MVFAQLLCALFLSFVSASVAYPIAAAVLLFPLLFPLELRDVALDGVCYSVSFVLIVINVCTCIGGMG